MPAHAGPALALFGLLAVAGVFKLLRPQLTAGALRAARLPHSLAAVRGLGILEVGVGAVGIAIGSRSAAGAGALLYAGFAWFVGHALRHRLPISSCGCLGTSDTPPTRLHLIFNVAASAFFLVCAAFPVGPWGGIGEAPWQQALPFAIFVGVTIYLFYAVIAVLPLGGSLAENVVNVPIPQRRARA